jgi:hypothetical protein
MLRTHDLHIRPWLQRHVTPLWKSVKEIESFFLISTKFNIGNRHRVRFWIDAWKEERIIQKFDILSTYAQQLDISVAQALQDAQNQTLLREIYTLSVQMQQV